MLPEYKMHRIWFNDPKSFSDYEAGNLARTVRLNPGEKLSFYVDAKNPEEMCQKTEILSKKIGKEADEVTFVNVRDHFVRQDKEGCELSGPTAKALEILFAEAERGGGHDRMKNPEKHFYQYILATMLKEGCVNEFSDLNGVNIRGVRSIFPSGNDVPFIVDRSGSASRFYAINGNPNNLKEAFQEKLISANKRIQKGKGLPLPSSHTWLLISSLAAAEKGPSCFEGRKKRFSKFMDSSENSLAKNHHRIVFLNALNKHLPEDLRFQFDHKDPAGAKDKAFPL